MKTLGLIGGMSWESTAVYYRLLNEEVRTRLGGFHSSRLLLASWDFAEVEAWQRAGAWEQAGAALGACARRLQDGGAEAILLCTNTMHRVAPAIEERTQIPLLHIGDAAGAAIRGDGRERVALLGTRYTMEQAFLRDRLAACGLEVLLPRPEERQRIDRVIYDELCRGAVIDASRRDYAAVVERLVREEGADAVLLGCTEIGLLLHRNDVAIPLYDSTEIHARAGIDFALRA